MKTLFKLLDYETKASEQVPLYMQMKNPDLALKKAIESGDSDLSITNLFCLNRNLLKLSFFKSIWFYYHQKTNLIIYLIL